MLSYLSICFFCQAVFFYDRIQTSFMSEKQSIERICDCGHPESDHLRGMEPPFGEIPSTECYGITEDNEKCGCKRFTA